MTDPEQTLAMFLVDADRIAEVVSALTKDAFDARRSPLMAPSVFVRVRKGTNDESRATQVVEQTVGREVSRGPGASPTTHLPEYRIGL